jgi:putative DNA primase/helicase
MNASLRFHPRCPHPNGTKLEALVALVERVGAERVGAGTERVGAGAERVGAGPVAIHRTFLRADGSSKANIEPAKAGLGPVGGGSVRLGMPRPGQWIAVAEGLETALAVATACSMSTWAALSAGGIRALVLPHEATHIVIASDHDSSGTGQGAARDAAQRWLAEDRCVRIALPSERDTDMADVLLAADTSETHHVA